MDCLCRPKESVSAHEEEYGTNDHSLSTRITFTTEANKGVNKDYHSNFQYVPKAGSPHVDEDDASTVEFNKDSSGLSDFPSRSDLRLNRVISCQIEESKSIAIVKPKAISSKNLFEEARLGNSLIPDPNHK